MKKVSFFKVFVDVFLWGWIFASYLKFVDVILGINISFQIGVAKDLGLQGISASGLYQLIFFMIPFVVWAYLILYVGNWLQGVATKWLDKLQ